MGHVKRLLEEQEHVTEVCVCVCFNVCCFDATAQTSACPGASNHRSDALDVVQPQTHKHTHLLIQNVHLHLQASVNLATETALVRVLVPKNSAPQELKTLGHKFAQVGLRMLFVSEASASIKRDTGNVRETSRNLLIVKCTALAIQN